MAKESRDDTEEAGYSGHNLVPAEQCPHETRVFAHSGLVFYGRSGDLPRQHNLTSLAGFLDPADTP